MAKGKPKAEPVPMTDSRIHLWKPLIVVPFLLWIMGSLAGDLCHSGELAEKDPKLGGAVRVGIIGPRQRPPAKNKSSFWTPLAYTAEELRDRMRKAPTPPGGRPDVKRLVPRALGATKGGPGDQLTASCADLRLTLVQLLRKVNGLKKREHSLFSALTEPEKQELDEANQNLTAVRTLLNARCLAPSSEK